ncbi:MAG TPA: LLM class flavin-dependent oxidoreductase [Xanthobacteraceae bacterium]|nr:LLM class flavin-dependent oxidoreductase [Xanthobacteraceae bacterium]
MKFGLFGGASVGPSDIVGDSHAYRDYIDYVCEAEALGFCSVFLVEHHFTGINQVSASLGFLTYLAAKTSRIRLGTAVVVLPWHNPVLLAEQAATLDLLSGGRFDFGIGRGYRHNEYYGFGIDMGEGGERYEECLEVIRKAWTTKGRFSHHGKYWRFNDIIVEPSPVQEPHPPFWIGANSHASIRRAGESGFNLLLGQLPSLEEAAENVRVYREGVESRGRIFDPHSVALCRALHVVRNTREREEAYEKRAKFLLAAAALAGGGSHSHVPLPNTPEENREAMEASALIGDAEEIIARLKRLEAGGVRHVLLMDVSGSREALRIFAREVMPAFAEPSELAQTRARAARSA